MSAARPAILALADGRVFRGTSFGGAGTVTHEIVFNTSMCGYQEILTDPSYHGQMVVMTYPQIGNYGVNPEDLESKRPWVGAFIVRENSPVASSWRSRQTLESYLAEFGIVGMEGIDTRSLVRHIRDNGAQMATVSTDIDDAEALVELSQRTRGIVGRDLVNEVTTRRPYEWTEGSREILAGKGAPAVPVRRAREPWKIIAYDFGVKRNILRKLSDRNLDVTVVPADTTAAEVLKRNPDAVFLSNGPGDPEPVSYAVDAIRELVGKKPIFGICLGHQILGLALGGRTFKLKFGHHGGNQPVRDEATGTVEITAQNHGFALDMESFSKSPDVVLTHVNLNDGTVEGLRHRKLPVFSVQYHPEASPGPHDPDYLFDRFVGMIEGDREA
ncbi:MAG: glutamine-hydrolyzing carbamoyl-phosphate synthase small subunit [Myxococcota bacterium]